MFVDDTRQQVASFTVDNFPEVFYVADLTFYDGRNALILNDDSTLELLALIDNSCVIYQCPMHVYLYLQKSKGTLIYWNNERKFEKTNNQYSSLLFYVP